MKATRVNASHLYFVDPNGHGRNANVEKHLERMPDVIQRTYFVDRDGHSKNRNPAKHVSKQPGLTQATCILWTQMVMVMDSVRGP